MPIKVDLCEMNIIFTDKNDYVEIWKWTHMRRRGLPIFSSLLGSYAPYTLSYPSFQHQLAKIFRYLWLRNPTVAAPLLTLKVLNFWTFIETWSGWIFDSYWSLKPLCSGMGEVVPARTSPTLPPPSPRTVLSLSCFKVSQWINCRD